MNEENMKEQELIEKIKQQSDYDKVEFINNEIKEEATKLKLASFIENEFYRMYVLRTLQKEESKLEALQLLESDSNKKEIIQKITSKEERYNSLDKIENQWIIYNILKELDKQWQIKAIEEGKIKDYNYELIKEYDETTKLSLLNHLSIKNQLEIILEVQDENKRYNYFNQFDDSGKYEILKTIKTKELFENGLKQLNDYYKSEFINNEKKEEATKLRLSSFIEDEVYRMRVLRTLQEEKSKLEALELLESDSNKKEIIQKIVSEEERYNLIDQIQNQWIRYNILKELDKQWQIKAIKEGKINDLRYNYELIKEYDEATKLSLLNYLYKSNQLEIILEVQDENKRYSYLNQFDDSGKYEILKTIKTKELFENGLKQLSDYNKVNFINNEIKEEATKLRLASFIENEFYKIDVLETLQEEKFKIGAIQLLERDTYKEQIIRTLSNENSKICLLIVFENIRSNLIEDIKDDEIREQLLSAKNKEERNKLLYQIVLNMINTNTLPNYKEIFQTIFKSGSFEFLDYFDRNFLQTIFDEKQIKVLNEYAKITNPKIKKSFSEYVSKNYNDINIENLDFLSEMLHKIEMSNSTEIQSFSDIITIQVLKQDNPIQHFKKIENIFIKNNIPYVGKIFEVFKLLHNKPYDYNNFSPLLNRFKNHKNQIKIIDFIIFNDLLKCAFGSNNRSLKEFLNDIEKGNYILVNVMNNKNLLEVLDDNELEILTKYLDKVEITLDSYDKWKNKPRQNINTKDILVRIDDLINRLKLTGQNYQDIPDILTKELCGIYGIDNFESAKKYFEYITKETNERNRERCNQPFTLDEGDFVKGINEFKYLPRILQNGSVSKEFLGDAANSDTTPLDTDLSRILPRMLIGKQNTQLKEILQSTISGSGYGNIWFVLKNDPNKIEVTRDSNDVEKNHNLAPKFSKLEAFKTVVESHYGIRTGFASSDISYIITTDKNINRIGLEIAINGFYIPVVDGNGKLVFTPEDYDNLRRKMNGLSYYGINGYKLDDSAYNISNEILTIIEGLDANKEETKIKADLIKNNINSGVSNLELDLKEKIDLSLNSVVLFNTGSTGRYTNLEKDGDYDYTMQVDRAIYTDEEKMKELRTKIIASLCNGNHSNYSIVNGDIRELKTTVIDEQGVEYPVEIDITFTTKTDKVEYASDVCVKDRLNNIKTEEERQIVKANIILTKKFLKAINTYKPARRDATQGGLGGIGVENWLLQNGGTLYSAAKSFCETANQCASFEEFKTKYTLPNFGYNHMAYKRGTNPHDDYIENMNEKGYDKMKKALSIYIKKYEEKVDNPVQETLNELNNMNIDINYSNFKKQSR